MRPSIGPRQAAAVLFTGAYLVASSSDQIARLVVGVEGPMKRVRAFFDWPSQTASHIREGETHADKAYGLDHAPMWPLLEPLLPEATRKRVEGARLTLDFFLVITLFSAAYTAWSVVYVGIRHGGLSTWLVALAAGLAVFACGVTGQHAAAREYGTAVAASFDLQRMLVLDALHLARPMNAYEERLIWAEVTSLAKAHEMAEHLVYQTVSSCAPWTGERRSRRARC